MKRIFQHPHDSSVVVIDNLDNDGTWITTCNVDAAKWNNIDLTSTIYIEDQS